MRNAHWAIRTEVLLTLVLAYGAASLFHHVHNAVYLNEYPNMPVWLSPARVYIAWLVVTGIGLAGYVLTIWRHRLAGLLVLGLYGALGLAGLDHYAVALPSAHTFTMNLTILFEVTTGILLMIAVAIFILSLPRKDHRAEPTDAELPTRVAVSHVTPRTLTRVRAARSHR